MTALRRQGCSASLTDANLMGESEHYAALVHAKVVKAAMKPTSVDSGPYMATLPSLIEAVVALALVCQQAMAAAGDAFTLAPGRVRPVKPVQKLSKPPHRPPPKSRNTRSCTMRVIKVEVGEAAVRQRPPFARFRMRLAGSGRE